MVSDHLNLPTQELLRFQSLSHPGTTEKGYSQEGSSFPKLKATCSGNNSASWNFATIVLP